MRDRFGEAFYMVYFQQLGPADAELARDPRLTFRKTLYSAAGESPGTAVAGARRRRAA
jgi:hypothetical protein